MRFHFFFFSIECPDVILQTIQTQSLHNLQKVSSHNNIMTLCTKNKEQNIAIKYWLLEGIMGISLYLDDTRECKCYDKKLCIGPYSAYKLVCIAGLNNYIRTNDWIKWENARNKQIIFNFDKYLRFYFLMLIQKKQLVLASLFKSEFNKVMHFIFRKSTWLTRSHVRW